MSSDVYRAECAVVCVTAVVSALLNSTLNALISFVAITHLILTPFKTVQKNRFQNGVSLLPRKKAVRQPPDCNTGGLCSVCITPLFCAKQAYLFRKYFEKILTVLFIVHHFL